LSFISIVSQYRSIAVRMTHHFGAKLTTEKYGRNHRLFRLLVVALGPHTAALAFSNKV
jgi:hypothetical protein